MIQLRVDQQCALNAVTTALNVGDGVATGRVVIPTGGGKTFIEAAIIDFQIAAKKQTRVHLVLAPRILLANQLIGEFRKFSGTKYRIIAFHSGHYEPEDEKIKWKETNTTKVSDVTDALIAAINCDQDLVVFSTYHSAGKLDGIHFETLIADESQYCVSENFNDAIKKITANGKFFFTATERYTASTKGRGLNNETFYGTRLYYITPAELIKLGLIVPPRLHVMHCATRSAEDSIISEVLELAVEQDKLTRPNLDFSKILFAMKGTSDVKEIEDQSNEIHNVMPDHDICTITSRTGAKINGVKIRREDFLKEIKSRKNCLIFHYDILSEGIDVDDITGVCLMRNLGLAKLLQTIGRAVRIFKLAPEKKKQAWISVSVINGDEDDMARVKFFVEAIRNSGYDISAEEVVETGTPKHIPDPADVDDAYGNNATNNFSSLFITEIIHEIEDGLYWDSINAAGDVDDRLDAFIESIDEFDEI